MPTLAAEPDGAPLDVTEQHRGEALGGPVPCGPASSEASGAARGAGRRAGQRRRTRRGVVGPVPDAPARADRTRTHTGGPPHEPARTRFPPLRRPRPGTRWRPASPHPERWGRVDADGTIYVRTADGERAVGSWQAGEPAEGLAHFARRFDDVLTEVELLASPAVVGRRRPQAHADQRTTLRDGLAEAARRRRRRRAARAARRAGRRRPSRPSARRAPSATRSGPPPSRARRSWPRRPRRWPPRPRSGSRRATGSRRSSTSGAPSAASTARPTSCCGSGSPRPARRSTAAAARTSPTWTGSAPAPGPARRSWRWRPRSWPTPTTGGPPRPASAT